jgi:hypothetical protein
MHVDRSSDRHSRPEVAMWHGVFPVIKKIWFRQVLVIKELWCFLNLFIYLFIVIMKAPYNSLVGAIEKTGMHMNIYFWIWVRMCIFYKNLK